MFVDASVIVAILSNEDGWQRHARKIEFADLILTSPIAIWEATIATTRTKRLDVQAASTIVEAFLSANRIRTIPITPEIGALAIEASRRFGRGRHPAALNLGDCFAYACAKTHGVPLLYKGEDFPQTDIEAA